MTSCYANFREILARFELGERSIVANSTSSCRFRFCRKEAPGSPTGSLGHAELRAERDVLAVPSNCP
jgi:hypothetical protein